MLLTSSYEKTMPGYTAVLSGRYGVDSLLAESYNILDLAYVGAQWRYTAVIRLKYYRCGLASWPPDPRWSPLAGGAASVPEGGAEGGASSVRENGAASGDDIIEGGAASSLQ